MYSIIYNTNKESAVCCWSLTKEIYQESVHNVIANMYRTLRKPTRRTLQKESRPGSIRPDNQNIKTLG